MPDYDWKKLGETCKGLKHKFTREAVRNTDVAEGNSKRLVFIVGLPRSGTSLVERVLAAHPEVYGAGELGTVHAIAQDVVRKTGIADVGPDELAAIGMQETNRYARQYHDVVDGLDAGAFLVVDKMPGNLMYLGLINVLFPHARVIHCVRNPLDTCLSCYFQRFNSSNSLAYTFNLEALAYTWIEQERMMEHWKASLSLQITDVVYEDLVEDFEASARFLLEFCGLDWSDSVLDFYKTDDVCKTASYYQVRKPVYRGSVGRWRNYEPYIQSLIEVLGKNQAC
jgi:hypothetical protein